MIRKEHIVELSEAFLKDSANYLIDVNVRSGNRISIFIENDEHVSIKDCIALSKHIESQLDREQQDFELEVSSPGIDSPFRHERQYLKYVGKEIEILMSNGEKFSGELLGSDSESIQYLPSKKSQRNKIDQTTNTKEAKTVLISEVKETRLVITI
jgi:ribosome maturation factor RimP